MTVNQANRRNQMKQKRQLFDGLKDLLNKLVYTPPGIT